MKLSKRGEYGLRAMIHLANNYGVDNRVKIKDIAAQEKIPVKFLEQILVTLKNAGLIHSKMGAGGGYYLHKQPDEITMGEIIRILDGPLAPIRCVSQTAYERCECPDEEACKLRAIMFKVRNAISDILDETTLADLTLEDPGQEWSPDL